MERVLDLRTLGKYKVVLSISLLYNTAHTAVKCADSVERRIFSEFKEGAA